MYLIPFFVAFLTLISGGFAQTTSTPTETPAIPDQTTSTTTETPAITNQPKEPPLESLPPEFREIEEQERANEGDHFTRGLLQMLLTLGIMVALIYYVSYLIRKMMNNRQQQINETSGIKILESRSLNQRTAIYLVEVAEKEYLIAESVNGVTLLDTPSRTIKG